MGSRFREPAYVYRARVPGSLTIIEPFRGSSLVPGSERKYACLQSICSRLLPQRPSSTFGPGRAKLFGNSTDDYLFTRRPDGLTNIDVVVVREGKNLKGWLLGPVVGTIGKGVLEKPFKNSVKAIEARNGAAREAARSVTRLRHQRSLMESSRAIPRCARVCRTWRSDNGFRLRLTRSHRRKRSAGRCSTSG